MSENPFSEFGEFHDPSGQAEQSPALSGLGILDYLWARVEIRRVIKGRDTLASRLGSFLEKNCRHLIYAAVPAVMINNEVAEAIYGNNQNRGESGK